ncbi:MAG: PDZ domain-containing protein [Gammaproteobacteria bacterium]|nr:PDZ domain-containing protein [Gammaproteobacteria bacterium]
MNHRNKLAAAALATTLLFVGSLTFAFAGESSEEDIKREVSYMAKKLLDMSGQDSYTVEQPPMVKPFIGICTGMKPEGIQLTCISPDSQAAKAGLKTGDLVLSMNGVSMASQADHKEAADSGYWSIVKKMKTGDVLKFKVLREGKQQDINVAVGSLSHPGYKLVISRK